MTRRIVPVVTLRWYLLRDDGRMIVRSEDAMGLKPRHARAYIKALNDSGFAFDRCLPARVTADPAAPLALIRALIAAGFTVQGVSQGEIIEYDGTPPSHEIPQR